MFRSVQRGPAALPLVVGGVIAAGLIGLFVALAFIERVPVGHVGIKIDLLGGNKGVDTEEIGPGRTFVGINEDLFIFPTFTQTVGWTRLANPELGSPNNEEMSFQTSEGLVVTADVGASISVDPTKVNTLFQKYRKGMGEIVDSYVRRNIQNALVEAAGQMSIESVYGAGKTELLNKAFVETKKDLAEFGIVLENMYWIGELRLPENVVAAINKKIAATQEAQQRQNEVEKAKAQAEIDRQKAQGEADAVLIAAKGQAEANRLLAASINQTLVEYKALDKWDGKLPTMMSGAVPFVNIK